MPWAEIGYMRWIPSLTWQCAPQIASVLRRVPPNARIVDVGAGGRVLGAGHIRVDVVRCPNTTLVADAQRLPFACHSVDLVIATGVLEHVRRADQVLDEIQRVLRPGGIVHIEVPFLEPHHDDPIDCRRFTVDGLEAELARRGFATLNRGMHIGPTVAMITLGAHYLSLWLHGRSLVSKAIATAAFLAWSVATWPLKFLDGWLVNKPGAQRLAFGVFCTGQIVALPAAAAASSVDGRR